MEKTLIIDGKEITFKASGGIPVRYKAQFGRDFFADVGKLLGLDKTEEKGKTNKTKKEKTENEPMLDTEILYNCCWVLAKTANKSISDPLTWLDTFEEFPVFEIYPQVQELLLNNFVSTKKK